VISKAPSSFSLDEPAILWADPALDITGEVVTQLARLESPAGR
jgi:Skp family chaperone for outer membrane proteins